MLIRVPVPPIAMRITLHRIHIPKRSFNSNLLIGLPNTNQQPTASSALPTSVVRYGLHYQVPSFTLKRAVHCNSHLDRIYVFNVRLFSLVHLAPYTTNIEGPGKEEDGKERVNKTADEIPKKNPYKPTPENDDRVKYDLRALGHLINDTQKTMAALAELHEARNGPTTAKEAADGAPGSHIATNATSDADGYISSDMNDHGALEPPNAAY
ncbi:MAG: hypothetical protein Q9166_007641 [cf. Caloplaca sp. 2 TL-2023]